MIRSMTGFGKAEVKGKCGKIKVEVRSVNHKYLEISSKLPEHLLDFEDRIRETAGDFIRRGKVNLNMVYEDGLNSADKITVDEKMALVYYRMLSNLKKRLRLEGPIRLKELINLPGIITYQPKCGFPIDIWPVAKRALKEAFENLNKSRLKEGEHLYSDIKKRVVGIERATHLIKERSKINVKLYKERLKDSIREVSGPYMKSFDKNRLEQEVALFAKNSDVTEEVIRILAHIKSLKECIGREPEVGKKLDFIAQELNREVNTIGSKASDFKISQKVIQIKSEVEKLREQAKNIE